MATPKNIGGLKSLGKAGMHSPRGGGEFATDAVGGSTRPAKPGKPPASNVGAPIFGGGKKA
jgi:hypothetical protein